jgi:hypothetical protein
VGPRTIDGNRDRFCRVRPADGALECHKDRDKTERTGPLSTLAFGTLWTCTIGRDDGALRCTKGKKAHEPAGVYAAVASHWEHVCAVDRDGALSCWQLRDGDSDVVRGVPEGQFTSAAVHVDYACALTVDGRVRCWGTDAFGSGASEPSGTYVQLEIWGGLTCALRNDGDAICWGLGTGMGPSPDSTPAPFTRIDLADGGLWGLDDSGRIWGWGCKGGHDHRLHEHRPEWVEIEIAELGDRDPTQLAALGNLMRLEDGCAMTAEGLHGCIGTFGPRDLPSTKSAPPTTPEPVGPCDRDVACACAIADKVGEETSCTTFRANLATMTEQDCEIAR